MRTQFSHGRGAAPGFTLVELLVVITILGVLMTLLASGVFKYLDVQAQNNTETTIRTVDKVLRQQIDAVLSAAHTENIPPSVLALATNNGQLTDIAAQKRARVIWKTLRLIQEFPMTYAEVGLKGLRGSPVAILQAGPYSAVINDLPPKQSYLKALMSASAFTPPGFTVPVPGAAGEASTLLLLALQQPRGGVKFSADDLHSAAQDTNGDGLKEIVDAWGNPMAFYRFPTGNPLDPNYAYTPAAELDRATPAGNAATRNPLDPEGVLLDQKWNNPSVWNGPSKNQMGAYWFEQVCHLVHDPSSPKLPPRAFNTPFVIASAGRDGTFGFNDEKFGPHWLTDSKQAQFGSMSVTNLPASNDNIYNFRLKLGARGD